MRAKAARLTRIRETLAAESIDTHESLAAALAARGIPVSQSTLSKDLRELGVVRVPRAEGGFRYLLPESGATLHDRLVLERELRDFLVSVVQADNLLVVKTIAGHAQSVCEAIDRIGWPETVGTIAGENTIFVATRSAAAGAVLAGRMAEFIGGSGQP
jgi:transcriptional regulator of arginine metabolism